MIGRSSVEVNIENERFNVVCVQVVIKTLSLEISHCIWQTSRASASRVTLLVILILSIIISPFSGVVARRRYLNSLMLRFLRSSANIT